MTRSQIKRIAFATLLAFAGLSVTTALGVWQYARAHRDDISRQVLAAHAVPLTSLVHPGAYVPEAAFARLVSITDGRVDGARSVMSCGRQEQGSACWLLAPILSTRGTVAVAVLGTSPAQDAQATLALLRAAGTITGNWTGRVQPAEIIDRGKALFAPSDSVTAINVNELAMRWHTNLLDGYVVLSEPPVVRGLRPLSSALILPPSGISWRNLIYAWQWWAFAGFALFLLARYVADVRREAFTLSRGDAYAAREPEELP